MLLGVLPGFKVYLNVNASDTETHIPTSTVAT